MSSTPVLERNGTSGSDAGGGLRTRLDAATSELADLVSGLDPGCLTGTDAKQLYAAFVAAERFCVAAKTLLAPRIEASMVWAEEGHPNAASLMAAVEGVPLGQARSTLELGRHLDQLPDTEEAIRQGKLSRPKAVEVVGAALLDPESEGELLAGAEELPLPQVKQRCQRARASSAHHDPVAAIKRTYANRSFSSWSDPDGTFCYRGTDTADRGAQILNHIDSVANGLRRQRRPRAGVAVGRPTTAGRAAEALPTSPSGPSGPMRSLPSSPGPVTVPLRPPVNVRVEARARVGRKVRVKDPRRPPWVERGDHRPRCRSEHPRPRPRCHRPPGRGPGGSPRLALADRSAPDLFGDGPGRPGRPAAGRDPPRRDL